MLKHEQTLQELQNTFSGPGKLEWIGLRTGVRNTIKSVDYCVLLEERGIEGDHFAARKTRGNRQVTLLQYEHLAVIAALCEKQIIDPALLRRNLLVSGINLLALRDKTFSVGQAILSGTGYCHPCSRMEESIGEGGYNAVRGHGGITARVIKGETIYLGDKVEIIPDE